LDSEELRWTEPNDAPEEGTLVAAVAADFDTGARLGRYVVLSHMGTGGMGVVYAAYDPELDRRIALKLMHQRGNDDEAAERASRRMLAEAKAMAQLSHPNVITVHDVGTIDGRVFIAMEFVEGVQLSEWMREPGRDWHEMLDVFIRAGRGLEAAHAAGLVHRDFKPDNVLVGADGRVRVLDFGLARRFDGTREVDRRDREAGTPAYMSPEQHLGKPIDHRADQFSFCVALYEALYGELPFAAKTRFELALAVTDGRVGPAPKRASVPNWVRWALLRGLDPDPEGRWENMAALLEALSRDPYHKVRRWAVGTGVGVAAAAVLVLLVKVGLANGGVDEQPDHAQAQCTNAGDRVEEVWNDDRRASMHEAFAKLAEPWALELAGEVAVGLDSWAYNWAHMHEETCKASATGEQSDTMLDRRMLCLDRRLAEFDEFVEVMTGPDVQSFVRAGEAVRKLPDLGICEAAAIEAGRDSGDDSVEFNELQRLAVKALERDLFRANSLEMTGTFAEAEQLVDAGLDTARALGDRRLIATALLTQAKLARAQGQLGSVAPLLEEAVLEAERASADHLRGQILIALARAEAELGEGDAAAARAREARAVLDRIGAGELEYAALDGVTALASVAAGEFVRAEQEARAAIATISGSESDAQPAPIELAELRTTLGIVLRELGRHGEARSELDHASVLWAEHYGEQHPIIASVRFERALVDAREGRYEAALTSFAEVLVVFERVFGANSLDVARASEAMAVTLGELGRYDEALRRYQQARAIYRANARDLALARTLDSEGVIRRELGQLDEALSLHQQALVLLDREPSAGDRAGVLVNLGEVLLALERGPEARVALDEALDLLATSAHADVRSKLAWARFLAARAWAVGEGTDPERARALAGEARTGFVEAGEQDLVAQVDEWLAG
jgi:tetratricopeptide (TPR) repeat protein/predicted Ser/Thr protein kinase